MEYLKINDVIACELKVFWGEEPTPIGESTKVIKTNNLSYEGNISFDNVTLRLIDLQSNLHIQPSVSLFHHFFQSAGRLS